MKLFTRIFIITCLAFISVSYVGNKKRELDFSSEKGLVKSVKYFKDSTNLFLQFGKEFESETNRTHVRTVSGSTMSRSESYSYSNLGVSFIYIKSVSSTPNYDFTDSEITNESEIFRIEINPNSKIPVFGLLTNESEFDDVYKLKMNGKWVEFTERKGDKHYFSYVTKYVNFNAEYISETIIDSLKIDYENTELMNKYYSGKKIKDFSIRDNDSFYLRFNN